MQTQQSGQGGPTSSSSTSHRRRRKVADTMKSAEPSSASSSSSKSARQPKEQKEKEAPQSVRKLLASLQKAQKCDSSPPADDTPNYAVLSSVGNTVTKLRKDAGLAAIPNNKPVKLTSKAGNRAANQQSSSSTAGPSGGSATRSRGCSVAARMSRPTSDINYMMTSSNDAVTCSGGGKRQRQNSTNANVQTFVGKAYQNQQQQQPSGISQSNRGSGSGKTAPLRIPVDVLDDLGFRFLLNIPDHEKFDNTRVCFQVELAHWFYVDFYCNQEERIDCPNMGMREFARNVFTYCDELKHLAKRVDEVIDDWRAYKSNVPTYGAILLDSTLNKVVLVQGFYASKNSWGFPKGKVNENEDPRVCAVREVLEETGYDFGESSPGNEHRLQKFLNDTMIRLYIVTDVPTDFPFAPRTRNEIRKIQWFNVWDLPTDRFDQVLRSNGVPMSANNFYTVMPFVQDLQSYIKKEQARRLKAKARKLKADTHPAAPARMNSFTKSEQQFTPLSLNALFSNILPKTTSQPAQPAANIGSGASTVFTSGAGKEQPNSALMRDIERAVPSTTVPVQQTQPMTSIYQQHNDLIMSRVVGHAPFPTSPMTPATSSSKQAPIGTASAAAAGSSKKPGPVSAPSAAVTSSDPLLSTNSHFRPVGNSPADVASSLISMLRIDPATTSSTAKSTPLAHPIPIPAKVAVPPPTSADSPRQQNQTKGSTPSASATTATRTNRLSLSETSAFTAIPPSKPPSEKALSLVEMEMHQLYANSLTAAAAAATVAQSSRSNDDDVTPTPRLSTGGRPTASSVHALSRDSAMSCTTDIGNEMTIPFGSFANEYQIQLCDAWKSFKLDTTGLFDGLPGFPKTASH